jgi:hypothetical protein
LSAPVKDAAWQESVRRTVAAAPELTAEQREKLRQLLRGGAR